MSLLENNKDEDIFIYIITTKLEEENKKELERIVSLYNKNIKFSTNNEIIPSNIRSIISKDGAWPMATYYRLFFNSCFPEINNRLLYLDCDTIINKNLSRFYNIDFKDNILA
jgi:lipopolysaccharide biosynthesis glycosyltransferase